MQDAPERMNNPATRKATRAESVQPRSGPVRYELIDKDGLSVCDWGLSTRIFETASAAAEEARRRWPDQEQDPDRTGVGWDVQQVGAE